MGTLKNGRNRGQYNKEGELDKCTQQAYSELAVHLGPRERKNGTQFYAIAG